MLFRTSIQFIRGIDEIDEPEVSITTSKDRTTGTASFSFTNPHTLTSDLLFSSQTNSEIKGMYLIDNEGVIITRNVDLTFKYGKPIRLTGLVIIKNWMAWNRFIRFLNRYSFEHNLKYLKFSPLNN